MQPEQQPIGILEGTGPEQWPASLTFEQLREVAPKFYWHLLQHWRGFDAANRFWEMTYLAWVGEAVAAGRPRCFSDLLKRQKIYCRRNAPRKAK